MHERGEEEVRLADEALVGSARPPTTLVDTAISSPSSSAPPSPMKIRAGLKLCGRKPTHSPTAMIATSGPMFGWRQQLEVAELLAVEEERAGADGDDAGGQPVEAVDQVDRLGHAEQPQHGDRAGSSRRTSTKTSRNGRRK